MCIYMYTYTHICIYIYTYIYIHIYIYTCTCMCSQICFFACVCVCTKTIMFMGKQQTLRNEPNWAGQSISPTSGCSIASSFAPHIRNFVNLIIFNNDIPVSSCSSTFEKKTSEHFHPPVSARSFQISSLPLHSGKQT